MGGAGRKVGDRKGSEPDEWLVILAKKWANR